jgi:uncharacterized protein YbaA (DUF1428 family)
MTYFEGFIVPVPEANKDSYQEHANRFAPMMQEIGVGRMVEHWDSDVAEGKATDFRKAVDAKPDEKIVFSWFEYPSKQERDAANQKMMSDPRMMEMGKDMPFDGKRMVMGGFDAIVEDGPGGGSYTDGIIVPVPEANRGAYRELAAANARIFREHGATRVIETLADDVDHGEVTDFYRAVQAKDGETVAFSFIEWPDKATRDQAWQAIMKEDRMQHGGGVFEGSRMFWGGFDKILDTAGEQASSPQPAPGVTA